MELIGRERTEPSGAFGWLLDQVEVMTAASRASCPQPSDPKADENSDKIYAHSEFSRDVAAAYVPCRQARARSSSSASRASYSSPRAA